MKRVIISEQNLPLLIPFFDNDFLKTLNESMYYQAHNLSVYLLTGKNYRNVKDESIAALDWLNSVMDTGNLFRSRERFGRLEMETDKSVKLVAHSVNISTILPGWYYPTGRICETTGCMVWWKIASITRDDNRLILKNKTGQFSAYLYVPEQTAGYLLLAVPEGDEPPMVNEKEETIINSFVSK